MKTKKSTIKKDVKKTETRGRKPKNPSLVKTKVPCAKRGRPCLPEHLKKNKTQAKVPGRCRGRPPLDPSKKKSTKKSTGKRGRPSGSINKINYFADNTTHLHLRMWEIKVLKGIMGSGNFTKTDLIDKIVDFRAEHPEFYNQNIVLSGQKIDVYSDLIEYMDGSRVLNFSKKEGLYSVNQHFKLA